MRHFVWGYRFLTHFSQELLPIGDNKTAIEELGATQTDCYRYGNFLHLTGDDLTKPVSQLSRGQITKIEFIKLLMSQNHILVLDELTNHLETDTREQMEEALQYYEGAILVASHDRYFLEKIGVDKELRLEQGRVHQV